MKNVTFIPIEGSVEPAYGGSGPGNAPTFIPATINNLETENKRLQHLLAAENAAKAATVYVKPWSVNFFEANGGAAAR